MIFSKAVIALILTLSLGLSFPSNAAECSYRVARDFRNIQTDITRADLSVGDVFEFLLETNDSLVRKNTQTNLFEPSLALSWEFDSSQNLFTFVLNQECRWSDGMPLTATDFVYAFQELYSRGKSPDIGGNFIVGSEEIINAGSPPSMLKVKALADDKLSVQITGDSGLALYYLSYMSYSPLPSHISNSKYVSLASPHRPTIGPFKVKSVSKDNIVLDRNPFHCGDKNHSVDFVEIVNRKKGYWEFAQIMAGNLDMVRYTPEKQLFVLQNSDTENPIARVEVIDENRQTYLLVNPFFGVFANQDIRRKIVAAIDYEGITIRGNAFAKIRKKATTLFYGFPSYDNYSYSTDTLRGQTGQLELRELMEKYGYSAEKPFEASIITYPIAHFESTAKMISSMLRKAHLDIEFVKLASVSELLNQRQSGNFEMFFTSWTSDYADPQSSFDGIKRSLGYLLNEENASAANDELNSNFIKPYVKLLNQLENSVGQLERFRTLRQLEELLVNSGLVIPIYTESSPIVVSDRVSELNGQFPRARSLVLKGCGETSKQLEQL